MQVIQSKAFMTRIDVPNVLDTIKTESLLQVLVSYLEEDELRMIRILLSNTTLELKMKDKETNSFESKIESPRGYGLSGLLFDAYLEYSLRKV